jgi:hypothetical protein
MVEAIEESAWNREKQQVLFVVAFQVLACLNQVGANRSSNRDIIVAVIKPKSAVRNISAALLAGPKRHSYQVHIHRRLQDERFGAVWRRPA